MAYVTGYDRRGGRCVTEKTEAVQAMQDYILDDCLSTIETVFLYEKIQNPLENQSKTCYNKANPIHGVPGRAENADAWGSSIPSLSPGGLP